MRRAIHPAEPRTPFPPRATPYEIIPDERYSPRALRVFAAIHPEYAAFDGERLVLTPRGRLALVAWLARTPCTNGTVFPGWFMPEGAEPDPALELAFEKIYDRRARQRAAQAARRRATGKRDGREFLAAGSPSTVELAAGIAAIHEDWGVDAAVMLLRDHEDLSEFVMKRVRSAGFATAEEGEKEIWDPLWEGLVDEDGRLVHPDLDDYMDGFLAGLAAAWRDYVRFENLRDRKDRA